jgi:hypothetical protein
MNAEVMWGIVFTAYIATSIYPLMKANNGRSPKNTIPGSLKLKQWRNEEAKGDKALLIWCAGLAILLGFYVAYTQQTTGVAHTTGPVNYDALLPEISPRNSNYDAVLAAKSPVLARQLSDPEFAALAYSSPSQIKTALLFAMSAFLTMLAFALAAKAWTHRKRLWMGMVYLLGRSYRLKKKASTTLAAFVDEVKQAADK